MTDRPDIDIELDELGEEVRRTFAGESLSAEQQISAHEKTNDRWSAQRIALWAGRHCRGSRLAAHLGVE